MAELAKRLLDLNICSFLPDHSNNLANQFRWLCFRTDVISDFCSDTGASLTLIWTT